MQDSVIHSASLIKRTHVDWSPLLEQPMASAEAPDVDSVPVFSADGIESDDVEAQIFHAPTLGI